MSDDSQFLLKGKVLDRYFDLLDALYKFHSLFIYNEGNDRAIVIIGGSFLDIVLEHILLAFFPEDDDEVKRMLQFDQPLGTFGNKVRMAYCLGLIETAVKNDLKLIGKIRNQFAHDLYASFDNENIKSWCKELNWHKISMMTEPPPDATTRDLYQVGVNQLITNLHGAVSTGRANKRTIANNF